MKSISLRAAAIMGAVLMLASGAAASLIARGKAAPAWSGKTIAGTSINSNQLKDRVVLLNFFSYY
jgi:hypothetical protein